MKATFLLKMTATVFHRIRTKRWSSKIQTVMPLPIQNKAPLVKSHWQVKGFLNIIVKGQKMEERQQLQNQFDRIVPESTCISGDQERICQNFYVYCFRRFRFYIFLYLIGNDRTLTSRRIFSRRSLCECLHYFFFQNLQECNENRKRTSLNKKLNARN